MVPLVRYCDKSELPMRDTLIETLKAFRPMYDAFKKKGCVLSKKGVGQNMDVTSFFTMPKEEWLLVNRLI